MENEKKPEVNINSLRSEYLKQCKEKGHPDFAPMLCYKCNDNVMMQNIEAIAKGEGWGITGCRKCFMSFCE